MQISLSKLLVTVAIYLAAAAAPISFIVRLHLRAERTRSVPDGAIRTVGDIVALVTISMAASMALLVMPPIGQGIGALASGAPFRVAELGSFCAAQALWSLPAAFFYVLRSRLPGSRFSVRTFVRGLSALVLGALVVSLIGRSALPLNAAGLIAQVVAGFLPLSAAANGSISLSIPPASGPSGGDAPDLFLARSAGLCVAVSLGFLLWRRRTPA